MAPSPSRIGRCPRRFHLLRRDLMGGARMEGLGGLLELVDDPLSLPDSATARLTMVASTVSRSSVEPTARLTSPSAWSSPTDRVSWAVRSCSSVSSRAFSMAMAAWSAKVSISAI